MLWSHFLEVLNGFSADGAVVIFLTHSMQVASLNDLLACDKAVPAQPLSWEVSGELADLYAIYMKKDPPPEKLSRLQYLLGINDSLASIIRESGGRSIDAIVEEEEKFVF